MLYAELSSVTEVLKHLPESERNRFSPAGWDAWMKWADMQFEEGMHRFDVELVQRFYEYETASEAVHDLMTSPDDVDLDDEEACMELLERAEDSFFVSGLAYRVVKVLKTSVGTLLIWSE